MTITQADREAAASIAGLAEMRPMILDGRFDDHPYVQAFAGHITKEREEHARTARNRDMWRDQCARQAETITALRAALQAAILSPKGVVPAAAEPFYDGRLGFIRGREP